MAKVPTITNTCPRCKGKFETWIRTGKEKPSTDKLCYPCDMISKGHGAVLVHRGVKIPKTS